jgi:hypothetical protein
MIGQYLPNNNETVTVAFHQKFCQLNSPSDAIRLVADTELPWFGILVNVQKILHKNKDIIYVLDIFTCIVFSSFQTIKHSNFFFRVKTS